MTRQVIQTSKGAPPLGAYSQGWRAGDFVYVTGTGPIGQDGKVVGDTVAEQTDVVIDNIAAILEAAGASLSDVVKSNVYLADATTFAEFNAVYARRFGAPYPARTTVGVDMRQVPGMRVEIEVVAYVGS
jgi:2-iminobutanoate/2-iminopropanoate deaminase